MCRSRVSSRAPKTVMPVERRSATTSSWVDPWLPVADDLGTARGEHLEQHGGLRFEMQRHPDATAGEGLPLGELRARAGEQGHAGADPARARHALLQEIGHTGSFHIRVLLSYMVTLSGSGAAPVHRMLASTPRVKREWGPWSIRPRTPARRAGRGRHFPVDTVIFNGFVAVWPFEFTSTPTYWYTPLRRPEMSTDVLCGFGLDGMSDVVDTSTPFS